MDVFLAGLIVMVTWARRHWSGDLKTGYLLRAKPRNQFVAQLCGAVVAIFLNVGLFILFTTASPCIL